MYIIITENKYYFSEKLGPELQISWDTMDNKAVATVMMKKRMIIQVNNIEFLMFFEK